ncbi:hypothetical protein [Vibrio phage PJN101]|nr:hypothetical protein [Vibrio phage PJN101]
MKDRAKTFLSDSHEEFGSVAWYVTNEQEWKRGVDAEIRLTDCNQVITLDFACVPEKAKKRLDKIDVLISSLERFRASLQAAVEDKQKQQKPY